MISTDAGWMMPILGSALALGFYDLCKKHAVRNNTVMPVLFFATLTGTTLFVAASLASGRFAEIAACSSRDWWLIAAKSVLVGSSWTCVYYAMRDLPISIAAPVRAFCRQSAGRLREVDYILVHHTKGRHEYAAREMDALLGLSHTALRSVQCKTGRFAEQ